VTHASRSVADRGRHRFDVLQRNQETQMNKGTAIVGFLLSFLTGMGLMWGIDHDGGVQNGAEVASQGGASAGGQASSPVPISADDPSWGKADAPVTIVEFSDFECPYCSRVVPTIAKIKQEYGESKVRLVWKHNPLPMHEHARPTAEAAATVNALGGDFWKFHDLAFAHQQELIPASFQAWAVQAGVDAGKFKQAFEAKKYGGKVDKDMALARQIEARSTPAFRINGQSISGALPFQKFKEMIDAQLAAADALARTGVAKGKLSLELTRKNFASAPPQPQQPRAPRPPQPEDTAVWKVPVADDDPVKGPKDALVTIIMFSDFQCPFCSRVGPTLTRLMEEYSKDVRWVWKDNALPMHQNAKPAAYLARAAYEKGGDKAFWAAHDALFSNQQNLGPDGLKEVANQLSLDWGKVNAALENGRYARKVDESIDLAMDYEVRSTPYFFINGRRLSGAQPYETFKELIDAQLQVARGLTARGVRSDRVFGELMKTAKTPPEPEKRTMPAFGKNNPVKGPESARVVIQEFSDFQCPFCSRANPVIEQILEEYPKDVKIVWRNMPLPMHPHAPLAAEAAHEVFLQGGNEAFWKYNEQLFSNQKALEQPDLERYAQALGGIDMARFKSALDQRTHKAAVARDVEAARQAGVGGATPAFLVNGYFVSGAQPFRVFDKAIKLALKGS
jgi:protein-disulfide isomerase